MSKNQENKFMGEWSPEEWINYEKSHLSKLDLPSRKKSNSLVSDVRIGDENCILSLPQQFMNRSGQPVASLMGYYKIPSEKVIVVHDELDTPFGDVRLKQQGGHGGHNGLRDIIQHIGKNFICPIIFSLFLLDVFDIF